MRAGRRTWTVLAFLVVAMPFVARALAIAVSRDALRSFLDERAAAGDPVEAAPVATTTHLLRVAIEAAEQAPDREGVLRGVPDWAADLVAPGSLDFPAGAASRLLAASAACLALADAAALGSCTVADEDVRGHGDVLERLALRAMQLRGDAALASFERALAFAGTLDGGCSFRAAETRVREEQLALDRVLQKLESDDFSPTACRRLAARIDARAGLPALARALEALRARCHDWTRDRSKDDAAKWLVVLPEPTFLPGLAPWIRDRDELRCLELVTRVRDLALDSAPGSARTAHELVERHEALPARFVWTRTVARALRPTVGLLDERTDLTIQRALVRALLVVRAHRAETGTYPATPSEEAPRDPWTGGPLGYSRAGPGVSVWSLGRNGRDDGGVYEPTWRGSDDVRLDLRR